MPKKASRGSRTVIKKEDGAPVGYYVYSNGNSIWGVGLCKGGEIPLLANKEVHLTKQAERIAWHQEKTASRTQAKTDAKK